MTERNATEAHIDGSRGEGGGQILRSALSLSALLGQTLHLDNIRAKRSKPGLAKQHLTAVRAAATICDAEVEGDTLRSQTLRFVPKTIRGGAHTFDIGSAGSTTLVFQTVLYPLLLGAREPSTVTIIGGTHNPMAPTFEYLDEVFLPLLRRMGARISLRLERAGYYPKGGGRLVAEIEPCSHLAPLRLDQQARPIRGMTARAVLSRLPDHIAMRELGVLSQELGLEEEACEVVKRRAASPGNVLLLRVEREEGHRALFAAIGERGKTAEAVAAGLVTEVRRYLDEGVAIDRRLADQLLLPCALAGESALRIGPASQHTSTSLALLGDLGAPPVIREDAGQGHEILRFGAAFRPH